jgi:manganese/zinc/iron transport system permease protein
VIVLIATTFFLASLLAAPRRGLIAGWLSRVRFRRELEDRTLLLVLYELSEPHLPSIPPVQFAAVVARRSWTVRHVRKLVDHLSEGGYLRAEPSGQIVLTEEGWRRAVDAARGQRLWALCLTEYPELATGVVDLASESVEGVLPHELVEVLKEKLREAGRWPGLQSA